MKNKKGFTLIELIFVVIIIAVLAAVGTPVYLRSTERAKAAEVGAIMAKIRNEQERYMLITSTSGAYATSFNFLPQIIEGKTNPSSASLTTDNFTYTISGTRVTASRNSRYNYAIRMDNFRNGNLCCTRKSGTTGNGDCPIIETVFDICS
ncbi:prepilin-type N-terminal cleavage/methylation domain-containing protein [Elusimicrobium posterum]|uniref:type IV pilin protein n=1 Tax=Elusimicrobium posterum TaxID=3116653 RepID=UPI003C71A6B2